MAKKINCKLEKNKGLRVCRRKSGSKTPRLSQTKLPFYRRWWFLTILVLLAPVLFALRTPSEIPFSIWLFSFGILLLLEVPSFFGRLQPILTPIIYYGFILYTIRNVSVSKRWRVWLIVLISILLLTIAGCRKGGGF